MDPTDRCEDVDECLVGIDDCEGVAVCNNTQGSFTCECPAGYRRRPEDPPTTCVDADECGARAVGLPPQFWNDCDIGATCENTEGGFVCRCPPPHVGSGTAASPCEYFNECEFGTHSCRHAPLFSK